MKRCPQCHRVENDETLKFCRMDGATLVDGSSNLGDEAATAQLATDASEIHTNILTNQTSDNINRATGPTTVLPPQVKQSPIPELTKTKSRTTIIAVAVLTTAIVSSIAAVFVSSLVSKKRTKSIESIAVMPFVNESKNADVEYLSDGMTETLISSLSQLPNLSVKPRSSVFRYKGKETNTQTIGKDLNVHAILNGRVVQRGQELSLFVELIDISGDKVVWSQRYDRKQSDLVTLQSEIARDVSTKLKTKLSGAEVAKVEKTYTANPEAYQLYLKGRYHWNKRTPESLKQAVDFFNQAVEKDPNYALAYSGLAETYVLFPNYSVAMPSDCMPKAKSSALRAIELDDSLAETHVALGIYYAEFAWNLPAAEKEFRRAIELNPNYATAHQQYGIECLAALGKFDEAIAAGKRAEQLDPLSPIIGADLANIMMRARKFDDALAQLNRVAALDPNFFVTYWYFGMARYGKGQYSEAVAEYRKAQALNNNPWVKGLLIQSLARAGQRSEAVKLLSELEAESTSRYVSKSSLALGYGAIGEKDKAFALLDQDVVERSSRPLVFSVNPIWDDLRDDSRFAGLVRRVAESKLD